MAKRVTRRLEELEAEESDLDTAAENESTDTDAETDADTQADARAEDEDEDMEDNEEEGSSSSSTAQARAAERKRIGKILDSKAAKGRERLARHIAFNSDAPAAAAIATLESAPKASGGTFSEIADKVGSPKLSPGAPESASESADDAKRISASFLKLRGGGRRRRKAA